MNKATLVYCLRGDDVLLGMKKRRFGEGLWNGFGGKLEPNEDIRAAAAREVLEECGLVVAPDLLEQVAIVEFYFADVPIFECHTFFARAWHGDPQETEEMRPQWFALDSLPFEHMWASDPLWLPRIFAGEKLRGAFVFDAQGKNVERAHLSPWGP